MAPSASVTTDVYVQSAVGMEGAQWLKQLAAMLTLNDMCSPRVRLYSTKTFKPLGSLVYHKENCQSIAFARSHPTSPSDATSTRAEDYEEEDEMSEAEKQERTRWLVSGGQDSRVVIWSLIDFGKT